jgi:L-malate glycosyltransferase
MVRSGGGWRPWLRSWGWSPIVTFLGKRPHADMPGLLSSGDLAVIPSLMEATSVAALEAMACELPVVASRVGGLPEIVDETVGRLFEPGDPEALARAVVALLRQGDLPALGAMARERVVDRWSNDRLATRHLEIYGKLLGRGGSGP